MKIIEVTPYEIIFDNGNKIYYKNIDGDAINYADFEYLVEEQNGEIYNIDFPTELKFEVCKGFGFRFGFGCLTFPVPCYSVQNGYYSDEIRIRYLCNGLHRTVIDTLNTQLVGEGSFVTKKEWNGERHIRSKAYERQAVILERKGYLDYFDLNISRY